MNATLMGNDMTKHNVALGRAVSAALALATLAATVAPRAAIAQDAMADASVPSVLEEVVVTAQRREQTLQEVPITVQVVGNELINDVAAEDMGDLNGFVPGLVVSSNSPTQPRYQIRGIQTGDFGVGTDPAVGVYVDGVYAARSGASLLAFNDIERIEVLKGPQGTLFGRNSAAGAVSIVTRQPADQFDAELKLRTGEYDKRRVEGMVNVPMGDRVALRVNGVYNESDGWVRDAATHKPLWPEENWAVRAALKWDITDSTAATLTWDHDEIDQLARPAFSLVTMGSNDLRPEYPANPAEYLDPLKAKVFNDAVGNEESRKLDGATLFLDHDFGFADFRSTTAWRQFETVNLEDEDGTNYHPGFEPGRLGSAYFDTANIEDNESFYQEFKLSGQTGAFDWVAGVSYYNEDANQVSDTHTYTDSVDTVLVNLQKVPVTEFPQDGTLFGFTTFVLGAYGITMPNGDPISMMGLPWQEAMYNEGKYQAGAAFGDVIWHATDRMNLTFGLRYTHDEKEFSWFNGPRVTPELDATIAALDAFGVFDQLGIPAAFYSFDLVFDFPAVDGQVIEGQKVSRKDSWDDVSPRLVIDYKVSEDVMVFGSLSKGYKAGGYNSVQPLSQFDNEDVWNLEAGAKTMFAELGLVFNASTFYYEYLDKQSISLVCPELCQYVVTTSDEKAFGVELDARWQPVDALTLSANLAYIDATYKDYVTFEGLDLTGEPTGEPKLSAALGASYVWELGGAGKLDLSAMHAYRGKTRCNSDSELQGSCQANPLFKLGEATNRTDVRLAWADAQDSWGAAFFVTNLFDERYVTDVNNITASTFGTPFAMISEPRQWGFELRKSF